jgi:hypothetical protein
MRKLQIVIVTIMIRRKMSISAARIIKVMSIIEIMTGIYFSKSPTNTKKLTKYGLL